MLVQTLHALERDGLINRDVRTAIPPRVEYSLTPLGVHVAE
jgi:DNA-binding HxlR family transcriptional regulator